jgi:hypothetical protein
MTATKTTRVALVLPALEGYTPNPDRTGLMTSRHADTSAARALAYNRASKISFLADAGHLDTASEFLANLNADIDAYIARHRPSQVACDLIREAAIPYRQTAPPSAFTRGDAVRSVGTPSLTGTVSHDYPAGDYRVVAYTVTVYCDPPHDRYGSKWTEQYHAREALLEPIDADQVLAYDVTDANPQTADAALRR